MEKLRKILQDRLPKILRDKDGQALVSLIVQKALGGSPGLPSASELAEKYRRGSYADDDKRVRALIRWAVAKNTMTGFGTGLGGIITLPLTIPASLGLSMVIQATMVGAIAEIYGHDTEDDQVRTFVLMCMLGNKMEEVAKQAGIAAGTRLAVKALEMLPGKVLIDINKRVGFRLLTKFGEKGVFNLVKLVPLAGGVVGGTFDGVTCLTVGKAAARLFRPSEVERRSS